MLKRERFYKKQQCVCMYSTECFKSLHWDRVSWHVVLLYTNFVSSELSISQERAVFSLLHYGT